MTRTLWPNWPPEPVPTLSVWWEGWPREAADLTRMRRELRAGIGHLVRPGAEDADADRLLLVFEELASNGLRHGRPPVQVLVARLSTGWLVEVCDDAVELPPIPALHRDAADGGMGLPLVAQLSASHGWTVHGDRKHVWARIDAPRGPGPASGVMPAPRRPAPHAVAGSGMADTLARLHRVIDDRVPALGFAPELRCTGPLSGLSSDVVTDLLAVLGEALANVARHARACSVRVEVVVTPAAVTLRVRDDGIGMAAAPRDGGLGDLRRRAAWHGGTLAVRPEPAGGTRLTWAVPRRPSGPDPRLAS
jgi:two-component sensor histidine kinase